MTVDIKLQIKTFMHQISVYEPNEFTAFGLFNLDLKLTMSVSIQQKVNKKLSLNESAFSTSTQIHSQTYDYDIGDYVGETCTNDKKYKILKNRWIPNEFYKFPISGTRKLKSQRNWLLEFPWLSYSEKLDGAFCVFCFLLYKVPSSDSVLSLERCKRAIPLQLNTARLATIEQNRKILSSIIETIILIGRQEIALRGHRDSGSILSEFPTYNDGNFRALLRFRVDSGDNTLNYHLSRIEAMLSNRSTSYISLKIQNEIIEICGKVILDKIVSKVNEAECFSLLADETTDISGIEQFSLCVRYIEKTNSGIILKEDFLSFVPVNDVTGKGLMCTLLETCQNLKLNLKHLVGQGYDGAAAMSGEFQGCAAKFMEKYPQALYVHCASHSLNLVVSNACNIPIIRNSLGSITETINFFRISAQRQTILKDVIHQLDCETKKRRLIKLCEPRWIERFDARSIKKSVHITTSSQKWKFYSCNGRDPRNFSMAYPLSIYLQKVNVDLASAMETANNLSMLIKEMRSNVESKFHDLFRTAEQLAKEIGEEIKIPWVTQFQQHRANYELTSAENYYRVSVFIPIIDHFITQLEIRFTKHKNTLSTIQNFLPNKLVKLSENEIETSTKMMSKQWPVVISSCENIVNREVLLWKQK
ncbi:hypothetical protein AGLY_006998 [Aphis glycines]|uniref:DUF4371 domain-containing protein n=1 Tax=Aphis glycines TaxID=307491 RepID=A0A6G0TPU0_APHGL|nr:hypothetical protein AGLY_006998 [Aphis glycines]